MSRMVWVPVALSLVMLSGCSSSASNPQVRELHQEVSQLNQHLKIAKHKCCKERG